MEQATTGPGYHILYANNNEKKMKHIRQTDGGQEGRTHGPTDILKGYMIDWVEEGEYRAYTEELVQMSFIKASIIIVIFIQAFSHNTCYFINV